MEKAKKYLGYLKYVPEILAGSAILIIVVLLTCQCIGRYVFGHTIFFVDDVVVCSFAWLVFSGCAAAYRRKMHYGLELVTGAIPEKIKPYYDILLQIVTTGLFAYLLRLILLLYKKSGTKILYTTGISYKVIYAAAIFGFTVMMLCSAWFTVEQIRDLKKRNQEVAE